MATAIHIAPAAVVIGTVVALSGTAQAKNPVSGEVRELHIGDAVFADEIIVTADGSALAIGFRDGRRMDMGGNSELALDADVFDPAALTGGQAATEQALVALVSSSDPDVDAIQQALLAGQDPSELEATAAGQGGAEDDGSSFVVLDRSRQQTTPDSGFNTDPISAQFSPVTPEVIPVVANESTPAPANLLPVANDDAGSLFENDSGVSIPNLNDILGDDPTVLSWISQGTYGSLAYNVNTSSWEYTLTADLDYLAEGETLQDVFSYLLTDANGDTDPATVTVTIIGTNDVPVIRLEGTDATGAILERLEDAPDEMIAVLSDNGEIAFSDVDLSDTHNAAIVGSNSTHGSLLGALVLGDVNQSGNTVGWSYSVLDGDVNFLREGATIVETFTVQVSDGHGGTATQNVVVTITGSNDRPQISGVASGSVVEDGDSDNDASTAQTATGQLVVADDDLGDTHTWSSDGVGSSDHLQGTIFGTFSINANGLWTYVLNNTLAQQLAAGETYHETYKVLVQDNSGIAASDKALKDVVITIVGTNDAPVVGGGIARVSEEGLPGGIPDTSGSSDTTNASFFTGSFVITDADNATFNVSLVKPADGTFKSGGIDVTWVLSEDGKNLTGYAGANGPAVMSVAVTDAGLYTVTLLSGLDHPVRNVEDDFSFNVTVLVSDGVSVVPTTLNITVEDDSPQVLMTQDGIMTNQAGILTGQLGVVIGGDGYGGYDLSGNLGKAPAGLVYVVTKLSDGSSVLTAYSGSAKAGNEYFSLTVDTTGTYKFELIDPTPVTITNQLLSYVEPRFYPDGVTSKPFGINGTTVTFTSPDGGVNVSQGQNAGIGVSNNHLENERLKLSFSNVMVGLSIIINDVHAKDFLTFKLYDENGGLIDSAVAGPPKNATATGKGLDGIVYDLASYFSETTLNGGFHSLVIHGDADGDPVRISNFSVQEPLFPETHTFDFVFGVNDRDFDSASGSLSITISADLNAGANGYLITGVDNNPESILGSSGNDRIFMSDLTGDTIDGGDGMDTLVLNGVFDLRDSNITNIEKISMQGTGIDSIILSEADVLSMSSSNLLQILGGSGDMVKLDANDNWVLGTTSSGFTSYTSGDALLLIQTALEVKDTQGAAIL